MDNNKLDLAGIPEPIVRGLEVVAQMARNMTTRPEPTGAPPPELPLWSLGVMGDLTREEIYDDYQCRC